jgi:D-alanyl-D-alanine carboxypeptidase (penicillin-binding protein 5/6)
MPDFRSPGSRKTIIAPRVVALACFVGLAVRATVGAAPAASQARIQTHALALNTTYPPPPLLGSAAIVYDVDRHRVIYAVRPDVPLPMASTTKLMTALLVLEHGRLDTLTTVSANAASIGQSTMGLVRGEVLSLRDLLYGLLLPSGNDAAIALAEAVGGTEANFVAMMNRRCAQLGCTHTHFTSPHGLDAPGHYASARDLLLIARAVERYTTFHRIVSTKYHTVPATSHNDPHTMVNVNQPLWWYPGVTGMKPGNTDNAGDCDVLSVTRGGRHLLAVFLGMPDRYTDVRDVLDYAFQNFSWYSPVNAHPIYPVDNFNDDSPYRYLSGIDAHGRPWRYYIGTGYYVRPPMLSYLDAHPDLPLPTSRATSDGLSVVQRFGNRQVVYNTPARSFSIQASFSVR